LAQGISNLTNQAQGGVSMIFHGVGLHGWGKGWAEKLNPSETI